VAKAHRGYPDAVAANNNEALRGLPSVEVLAASLPGPRAVAVVAAREVIDERRAGILAGDEGEPDLERLAAERAGELSRGALGPVINATGVILHTNLGRAPLAPPAADAAARIAGGYSNLEYDLEAGQRGSRHSHLEEDLRELSGAEAAIAVNNNAAAVLLALAALASDGEVIVGRDQLIEIGGSFRIPEILAQSGAAMVEVGTTNRTRAADYEAAIGPRTRALLRVHRSNFRLEGFTETVGITELCGIGEARGVPVIDDLGSGALEPIGDEPLLRESVEAGADLVCCSADKLLGGPQAGIIAGSSEAVARCRSHPLARALRLDKLQIAALAETLRMHRYGRSDEVPAVAMLRAGDAELRARAEALAAGIGPTASVIESEAMPGGGTLPATRLAGPVCAIDPGSRSADEIAAALRRADPPVVARIESGRVILDPRTVGDEQVAPLGAAAREALG
jgi:L-seryl-tRNA(Ser) seleniumtransferase